MQPLIGMTMNEQPDYGANVRRQYYEAVSAAGGLPLGLPPLDPALAGPMLDQLDGLLLTGGGDIEPCHFGEAPLPGLGQTEPHRDLWELALARAAWQRKLPILAICRGMQMLNVALGGTLWQDARYLPGLPLPHQQQEPPEQATQRLRIVSPALAELLGTESVSVNSHHHQMLLFLSPQLQAAAFAADGVVEAVLPAPPYAGFCLGVQWHPERLNNEQSRRIFARFVEEAQEYREK